MYVYEFTFCSQMANTHRAAKRRHNLAPGVSPGTHVVLRSSPIGAKDSVTVSRLPRSVSKHEKIPRLTPGGEAGPPPGAPARRPMSFSDPAPWGQKIPSLCRPSGPLLPSTKSPRADARGYLL